MASMNVAVQSHGDYEGMTEKQKRTRKISRELNLPAAVLLDIKSPQIRLRDFKGKSGKRQYRSSL